MPSLPLPQRLRPHGGRQPTGGAVVDWLPVRRLLDLRNEEGMPFPGGYQAPRGRQEEGRRARIVWRRPEQTLATSGGLGSLQITGSSVEEVGKRLKVTAETNRGGIAGW